MSKNGTVEQRYLPEISRKEMDELKNTVKIASQKIIADNIERMKRADPHRPEAMKYFDDIANLFGRRQQEIQAEKEKGKKVIGYMCLFAPTELILAADAIPVRVNSGWYDTSKLGDRVVPVEVCPVIRSTIGAKMIELSPFLEQSDALISVLTCDGMTKLSEILSDQQTIWGMNVPRIKDSTQSLRFWSDEIKHMKTQIESFTGNKITRKNLNEAITQSHRATKAFRRLQNLRRTNPVIMGRDAMLVNQAYTWDDTKRWTEKTELLCDELEKRAQQKDWVCSPDTPRVMITGTPMFWPDNWKLPTLVEEGNPQGIIVADEQCSGERILNDPIGVDEWSMDDMLNAISERYLMASTCPCFTSKNGNEDRINWLINKAKEWNVQGVVYYVVRGCMLYAMEYSRVKKALDKINVPVYYLDTEYTREDVGQLKTRVEAFMELLNARVDF
ncbi:MAG: 2-hydroxyacyl-CoA dehydratase family protein [Nitrososphaerota archaeon]|uniref:2-hydroxyacyl-CoA dehydratase subunit D n=1 Tax=Candidatus Bathycorpusculum sp. TaxID=2994959 RepID=UPI002821807A|nr:2-hydroxyacyl-CoA dehydratase family protein [Candidatus Termitimicrobium sp.]MCL2432426.1 2-hydroxyacyl-CoA dehydratase family protein [Candidatus Termitimicrobium sp.]MDR0492601.1 2-hydroxyacyl-CoA dehydratase family protein [Nitrososphaerota archaeon]